MGCFSKIRRAPSSRDCRNAAEAGSGAAAGGSGTSWLKKHAHSTWATLSALCLAPGLIWALSAGARQAFALDSEGAPPAAAEATGGAGAQLEEPGQQEESLETPSSGEDATQDASATSTSEPLIILQTCDKESGQQIAPRQGERTVSCTVSYAGLTPATSYDLTVGLHALPAQGSEAPFVQDAHNEPIRLSQTFQAQATEGTLSCELAFDTARLNTDGVVVFGELREQGNLIASCTGPEDPLRSVWYPQLTTALVDGTTSAHLSQASPTATLVDTIMYQGLLPTHTYTCTAQLYPKDASNSDGTTEAEPLAQAEAIFTPTAAQGSVTLSFPLDTTHLVGTSVVTCEQVYLTDEEQQEKVLVAERASDATQTVRFIQIDTQLSERSEGSQTIAAGMAELVDTVRYQGLTPGTTYELVGVIHRQDTLGADGGVVNDASGNPLEVRHTFTPQSANGTEQLAFSLDASPLTGSHLVCFVELYESSLLIASHTATDGPAQTVTVATEGEGGKAQAGELPHPLAAVATSVTLLGGTSAGIVAHRRRMRLPYAQRRRRRHYQA